MRKHINLDKARRFMEDARAAGILVHGCFVLGMPGETEQTMEDTMRLALELDPDTAQFYPLMAYPGSPAYDEVRNAGLLAADRFCEWLDADGHHTAMARTGTLDPDDIVRSCIRARRRFYLRPRYLMRSAWRAGKDPGERVRILRAARTFWRHLICP
jgi:radical SAM superfamily enzyme YgiQ (UPF0313 family)